MTTHFTTALEAQKVIDGLRKQLKSLNYNPDLKKMITNLDVLVDDLSKAEVMARQVKAGRSATVENCRLRLSQAIDYADKMLFLAKFCQ
jgi:hypothetical protein